MGLVRRSLDGAEVGRCMASPIHSASVAALDVSINILRANTLPSAFEMAGKLKLRSIHGRKKEGLLSDERCETQIQACKKCRHEVK